VRKQTEECPESERRHKKMKKKTRGNSIEKETGNRSIAEEAEESSNILKNTKPVLRMSKKGKNIKSFV
jgi:hypothetical protein